MRVQAVNGTSSSQCLRQVMGESRSTREGLRVRHVNEVLGAI
jgi:hypothetical protein